MIKDILNGYLKGKQTATQRAYTRAFKTWCNFNRIECEYRMLRNPKGMTYAIERVCERKVKSISKNQAIKYINSLQDRGLSDNTIRHAFFILRTIHGFLYDMELTKRNPFSGIQNIISWRQRREVRPTKLIPFDVVPLIIQAAESSSDPVRNKALLCLLFGGGFRRSEVRCLRLCDILVSQTGSLLIQVKGGKSGKVRYKSLPSWAWEAYSELVQRRRKEGAKDTDYIFVSYYKSGSVKASILSESSFYRVYKKCCAMLGIDAGCHSARATFATKLWHDGAREIEIADELGHGDLQMVGKYVKRHNLSLSKLGAKISFD